MFLPADIPSNAFDLQIVYINQVVSILYVSGGQLASTGEMDINVGSVKNDSNTYPFTRLSSILSKGGKFYVYHQLDLGTIGESVYDPSGSDIHWIMNEIRVPDE